MILSMFSILWTLILGLVIFLIYKWLVPPFDFFIKKNIRFESPFACFRNSLKLIFYREHIFEMIKRISLKYKDCKYYGVFDIRLPILMIHDPDIIKQITIKDFDSFVNHRRLIDPQIEPLLGKALFGLTDQTWKDMRATLSPAYTGSKMRLMFRFIDECGRNANEYLKFQIKENEPLELDTRDLFRRITVDVIATCAFGIRINSLLEKDNHFYNMSKKVMNFSGWVLLKILIASLFTKIAVFFGLRIFDKKFADYFTHLVVDTMKERAAKGIIRHDMIHILMEAQKGTLQVSDVGQVDTADGFATVQESELGQKKITRTWSDEYLVAQCLLFFIAGFENPAVLMCLCAHELMENPDIQEKLIEEIDQVREELDDRPLTYEVIQKMKYMDMMVSEILRKWPMAGIIDRVCNKSCIIGDKDGEHVKLEPGDIISVPIVGLHYNPKYYPDPYKFDPERFSDENKHKIQPFTFLPFGVGPRNCIGSRFALMQAKAILFHLLSEFKFEASPKSCIPLELAKSGFQFQPKGGFWLNFVLRK